MAFLRVAAPAEPLLLRLWFLLLPLLLLLLVRLP